MNIQRKSFNRVKKKANATMGTYVDITDTPCDQFRLSYI